MLAAAVCLYVVADGHNALLQGLRRIGDLAKATILGAALGMVASVGMVYAFGEDGIATALIALSALTGGAAVWFSAKVTLPKVGVSVRSSLVETGALLRLGAAFLVSGILMMGAAYAVRTMIFRLEGATEAGMYSAAWTLGGLYVNVILQAMAADFYPRLVAVIETPSQANRLVNQQIQVGLLLAVPGVLATLVLAPEVISVFYSSEFSGAAEILRWICAGIALRVITWPIGFIVVARNVPVLFIAWRSFAETARFNLHIDCLRGRNTHHILEGTFKASARALRQAVEQNSRVTGVPSTKGSL
jgi:PST family polysaccharide transporter